MFRLIRFRLALSYAGIALLVTLALGAVLLVRLRAYYSNMERDYLMSNARAISGLAAPILAQEYPLDVQEAQVSNLAFLSQTRVRLLDAQKNILADSGPWPSADIGLGVVRAENMQIRVKGIANPPAASVIVLQKRIPDGSSGSVQVFSLPGGNQSYSAPVPENGDPSRTQSAETVITLAGGEQSDMLFFNADIPVSNGVYGLYLSGDNGSVRPRSSQIAIAPINGESGALLGYIELSDSPAYGTEIVNSVASGLAVAGGLAILLAIVTGWLASRVIAAPLSNLTLATKQMSSGDLSVRVHEANRRDEFGTLGKSFNQMAKRIEETIQTLRRFLSDAAHELQTPLTALRTNLELARSEPERQAADRFLGQALEQVDRLQRLVQDLLSLSRLESANGQEEYPLIDLKQLVLQTVEPFAARAEQAGQTLNLSLIPDEALVKGSPGKLSSALGNLLDNALKFTPPGGAITVLLENEYDNLFLTVRDTGIGIPPDEVDMLFNRFHRGRNASTYPGSGLGLAIVNAIAHAHGGSVRAANNPTGGASFIMQLPPAKNR